MLFPCASGLTLIDRGASAWNSIWYIGCTHDALLRYLKKQASRKPGVPGAATTHTRRPFTLRESDFNAVNAPLQGRPLPEELFMLLFCRGRFQPQCRLRSDCAFLPICFFHVDRKADRIHT